MENELYIRVRVTGPLTFHKKWGIQNIGPGVVMYFSAQDILDVVQQGNSHCIEVADARYAEPFARLVNLLRQ